MGNNQGKPKCYNQGYNQGYNRGNNQGWNEGHKQGYNQLRIKQARVNGGSNYDSLKVAKCLAI